MSDLALPAALTFTLPRGWHRVPRPEQEAQAWADSIVATTDPAAAPSLAVDLARIAAVAHDDAKRTRTHFAYLATAVASRVQAFMTVDYFTATESSYDDYLAAVSAAAPDPSSAVYAQQLAPAIIAGEPAVLVHDFLVTGGVVGVAALQERYLCAIFPVGEGVMVEFQITTPDLALFPDIVSYGDSIATTLMRRFAQHDA